MTHKVTNYAVDSMLKDGANSKHVCIVDVAVVMTFVNIRYLYIQGCITPERRIRHRFV